MIEIDGAMGEGGGQILRSALALSMCTGQPFRLRHIRAGRPKPGLMRQHLTCVKAAAELCQAQVQGDALQSTSLSFVPGEVKPGAYRFDIGSAGSCTLVLQTVWPALWMQASPSEITLVGGTHNPMAPSFHFLQRAYLPLLERLGVKASLSLRRLGFYPAGGGEVQLLSQPLAQGLRPFDLLTRGEPQAPEAECWAPALHRSVAPRQLAELSRLLDWPPERMRVGHCRQNEGPGNALLATLPHAHLTEVFMALGEKGVSSEVVAARLAEEVRAYQAASGALGPHLADQWALPLALALWASGHEGDEAAYTCTEITPHTQTHVEVISAFLPVKFNVTGKHGCWRVTARRVAGAEHPEQGLAT